MKSKILKTMTHQKSMFACLALLIQLTVFSQEIQISPISLPSTFAPSTIADITQDKLGNIWLASISDGLLKYNGLGFTSFKSNRTDKNSIISDRLECIHGDNNGNVWIGSFTNGLSRYNSDTELFTAYTHNKDDSKSIRSNSIRSFAEDERGGIWIGTVSGIDYWNPDTESFEHNLLASEDEALLQQEHVRTLYIDRAGFLWAGTSSPFFGEQTAGGLFKIDPETKSVKRYASTEANKLTSNIVTAIYEDSSGTFWIGTTGDGLHTMDREIGMFTHHPYDASNPTSLSRSKVKGFEYASDHIRFIKEDKFGRLWIGTMNNGINLYDPSTKTVQHLTDQRTDEYRIPNNDLWAALISRDGLLWLTAWSPNGDINYFLRIYLDALELNFSELNVPVYSFVEDNNSKIIVGSQSAIYRIDDNKIQNSLIFENENIHLTHINKDSEGNLWASTERGLLYVNASLSNYELYPINDPELATGEMIEVFVTDDMSKDSILVATSNGLYFFDAVQKKFTLVGYNSINKEEKSMSAINDLLVDSRNNIWVGYANYGLMRLDANLKTYTEFLFLDNIQDGPTVIYEDDDQTIYVANRRGGLRMYQPEKDTFELLLDKTGILTESAQISAIQKVESSQLWLTTNDGLAIFDLADSTAKAVQLAELNDLDITSSDFFSTQKGDYYLGTSTGYIKYKPEDINRQNFYRPEAGISKIEVNNKNLTPEVSDGVLDHHLLHNENNLSFTLSYINYFSDFQDQELEYKLDNHDLLWRKGQDGESVYYYQLQNGDYNFKVRASSQLEEMNETSLTFKILSPWWQSWWAYLSYLFGAILFGILLVKYQRERTIKLEREKARDREIEHAKEIEKAYADLKTTQEQLLHAEKMANLGELTAGIAHEIQNPLNFVNNFAEVSAEMVQELKEELEKGDIGEAKDISTELIQNLEKINDHGSRASNIVKGMLAHSRTGSGGKELADINVLCEEYMRLSYHGLRAKDKNFNSDFELSLDKDIRPIEVVPQDIGRVLLNIINNAFYTVNKKIKAGEYRDERPKVKLVTKSLDQGIEIQVIDNGQGMSQEVVDKIFQPFFTTKPTGEGTGLGMSISYDIITKGHGGQIGVQSEDGHGTTFTISLPQAVTE